MRPGRRRGCRGQWLSWGAGPSLRLHPPRAACSPFPADYASYVLLLLSAASSLTHLAVGACVWLAAAGRPPRAFLRLLLSFEPLVSPRGYLFSAVFSDRAMAGA